MSDSRSPLSHFLPELERIVDKVAVEDGPALIGDLERIKARLLLRLVEASRPATAVPTEGREPDRLLSVPEAAKILAVKIRWLCDHSREIPGRVQLPGRLVRFSLKRLESWIRARSP